MKRSLLLAISLALFLAGCSFSLAEDIPPPAGSEQLPPAPAQQIQVSGPLYPLVPPNAEAGKAIFAEKCAPCHGAAGQGDGPRAAQLPNPVAPIGSAELARQSTPADWYIQVTQGNLDRFMPPFNSLSDRQRWDVVAYAFSLSVPAEALAEGETLYADYCARCHGDDGKGDGPDAAGLTAPPSDFTDQQEMAQKTAIDFYTAVSEGVAPDMPAFAADLSSEQLWALAAYVRNISFTTLAGQQAAAEATAAPETLLSPEATQSGVVTATLTTAENEPTLEATPVAALPEAVGMVSGLVVNASGGEIPANLQALLRGFDDMQEVYTRTTTIDSQGAFSFENVDMPAGRVFMVTVEHNDMTYGSDIAIVEQGMTDIQLPVEIYETTTDASVLRADRVHLFFEFVDEQTVRVVQLFIMSNTSDRTLVAPAEGEPTVRFTLPENARNLEFQDGQLGGRYVQTNDGFGDTTSIRPGQGVYELLYAFDMPYDRKLDLSQPLPVPVDAVVILVPDTGIKVKGETLVDAGTRDVQGMQYHLYNGGSMQAGDLLSLTISGQPLAAGAGLATSSSTGIVIGLGAFGLALVLSGIWLYRRTRPAPASEDEDLEPGEAIEESADSLLDAIVALDDLYKAGKLPEEAYQERRAELKSRLRERMG